MKSAAILIPGRYPESKLSFYRKLCRGRYKIAVDGGYNFFKKVNLDPDLIIGDFDSLNKSSIKTPNKIRVISFPERKDETDTELAVKYCLEKKISEIDLVIPTFDEPDHFMGLISILANPKVLKSKTRLVNHRFEIKLIANQKLSFDNCIGELISVKAVCEPILLTCSGTEYDVRSLEISPWESKGLRNVINSKKAAISVKGWALIFHYWDKGIHKRSSRK